MFRPYIVWPWLSGLSVLVVGLAMARRELATARGLDTLVVLGPVFMAAPLAAFGANHFVLAPYLVQSIPAWMPARLFLNYLVGGGLLAAAVSFVFRKHVPVSGSLLALMFLVFVVSMHVPNALGGGDRFAWTVAMRDLSFGAGALAWAGMAIAARGAGGAGWMVTAGRVVVGVAALLFGVEHFLHPEFAPGVPLLKLTPPWIPVPRAWGYATGAVLLAAGGAILANRRARSAATWLGLVVMVLVLVVYLPFVPVAVEGGEKLEALNFVWDTVLWAGTVLCVAGSLPRRDAA